MTTPVLSQPAALFLSGGVVRACFADLDLPPTGAGRSVTLLLLILGCGGKPDTVEKWHHWRERHVSVERDCTLPRQVSLSSGRVIWGPLSSGAVPFGMVRDAVVQGSDVFLADGLVHAVHVVSTGSSRAALTLGRSGAGPGEFRNLSQLAAFESGHLAVLDRSNVRVSLFEREGRDWRLAREFPARGATSLAYDRRGSLVVAGMVPKLSTSSRHMVVRVDDSTVTLDPRWRTVVAAARNGNQSWRPAIAILPDGGFVLVDRHEPLLLHFDSSGVIRTVFQPCQRWARSVVGRNAAGRTMLGTLTGAVSTSDSVIWWSVYPPLPGGSPILVEVSLTAPLQAKALLMHAPHSSEQEVSWEVFRRVGRCRWLVWSIREASAAMIQLCASGLDSLSA
jgi:hypothetical protein